MGARGSSPMPDSARCPCPASSGTRPQTHAMYAVPGSPEPVDGSPPRERIPAPELHSQRDGARDTNRRTSCAVFMTCTALAIIRAIRDGAMPWNPRLDFQHQHMNWLRVHMVHRYCPPLYALTRHPATPLGCLTTSVLGRAISLGGWYQHQPLLKSYGGGRCGIVFDMQT